MQTPELKSEIPNPKRKKTKPNSGNNATRNTKIAPKVRGDPKTNMQTPKLKSEIPSPKLQNLQTQTQTLTTMQQCYLARNTKLAPNTKIP